MNASIAAFRRVLGNRRLRRLLGSFFLFGLAEWGTWVTILVWAYEARGPGFVGVVAAVQLVFAAVAAPGFSMLGDRMPRSRALALTYVGMAASLAATGAALLFEAHVIASLLVASIATATFSVGRPIHASLIPDLSDEPADAVAANVVSSMIEGAGTFLGPAFAGVVLAVSSPGLVFLATGAGAGIGALMLSSMGDVNRAGGLGARTGDGLRVVFRSLRAVPSHRFLIVVGGVSQLVAGALDVLAVVLALEVLGLDESGAGFTVSLLGLGGLVGGLLAVSMVGRRVGPALLAGGLLRGGALMVLGVEPSWLVLLFVSGSGFSLVDVGVRTLLQRLVPPDAMSRVFGVLESVSLIGLASGSLLASGFVAVFGAPLALVIFGSLIPFTLIVGYRLLVAADREADVPRDVIDAFETVPLFALLTPPTLEMLARRSRIAEFRSGDVLIAEGDSSRFVLLVIEGKVEVTKDGRVLASLGPTDIVGEIAALHDSPRTASVIATQAVTAISVPGDAFVSAVRGEADAWSMSASVAGHRLAEQEG